jgi:hypothetical protein
MHKESLRLLDDLFVFGKGNVKKLNRVREDGVDVFEFFFICPKILRRCGSVAVVDVADVIVVISASGGVAAPNQAELLCQGGHPALQLWCWAWAKVLG